MHYYKKNTLNHKMKIFRSHEVNGEHNFFIILIYFLIFIENTQLLPQQSTEDQTYQPNSEENDHAADRMTKSTF